MTIEPLQTALQQTLGDLKLSRGERQALAALIAEADLTDERRDQLRRSAFDMGREALTSGRPGGDVLDWLEDVVRLLTPNGRPAAVRSEAWFSPGDACVNGIRGVLRSARRTIDLCVFTITDNRIRDAVLEADRRGVRVRIVTDNDKANDLGSDIATLAAAGISVRIDRTEFHMHHKFAIFDGARLLTGSYNWTRQAARENEENCLVTDDPDLIAVYQARFDDLWTKFETSQVR